MQQRNGELAAEEKELSESHGLLPAQIAYRREIRSSFRRLAAQEFAEDAVSCFLSYGECVFDQEAVERRRPGQRVVVVTANTQPSSIPSKRPKMAMTMIQVRSRIKRASTELKL